MKPAINELVAIAALILACQAPGEKIFSSFNQDAVSSNPPIDPVVQITKRTLISSIYNYHYAGSNAEAQNGTIGLRRVIDGVDAEMAGSWPAASEYYQGRPIYWLVHPNIVLTPGFYKVVDSDHATWSYSTTRHFDYLGYAGAEWKSGMGFSDINGMKYSGTEPTGELVIQGPDSIASRHNAAFSARLDGVDVTDRCLWPLPKCNRSFDDWYRYPSTSSRGILDAKSALPGDTIEVKATYSSADGERHAAKIVTVTDGGGLSFDVRSSTTYVGPAGQNFEWQVSSSVYGPSAQKAGVTFTWYLDGALKGNGTTLSWTRTGRPSFSKLRVVANDGNGNSAEEIGSVAYLAPAPGEPGQRYAAQRRQGVVFVDKDNKDIALDPARMGNGLIVITHGLRGSPSDWWIQNLAREIETKLAGSPLPNIVIFGWEQNARPSNLYDTSPERLAKVSARAGLRADVFLKLLPEAASLDFLYDLSMITATAEDQGRSSLAKWLRDETVLGNISKTAPIHLIGHSAGGFVIGECCKELKNDGFNIRRVTMLDTPFADKNHFDPQNPAVIERYVSSIFGALCPDLDGNVRYNLSGGLWAGLSFAAKPESAVYHHLNVGSGGAWNPIESHGYSHEWYRGTVQANPNNDGFQLSPFIASVAPAPTDPKRAPLPPPDEPQEAPLPPSDIAGFTTFGNVTATEDWYVLTEGSNSGIVKALTLPADAAGLKFNYRFTSPGDGDYIVVYFGDSQPLFIASPSASNTNGSVMVDISLAAFAGQTGDLVIKLIAQEEVNAAVKLDTIQMTRDDDLDGDGLATDAELTAATNPLLADTDGDGLDDSYELSMSHTRPLVADSDGDGMADGMEVAAGTDPLDGASQLVVKSMVKVGTNFTITWSSAIGKHYRVLRSLDPGFGSYDVLASGVPSAPPQQSVTDGGGATTDRMFYRVELEP